MADKDSGITRKLLLKYNADPEWAKEFYYNNIRTRPLYLKSGEKKETDGNTNGRDQRRDSRAKQSLRTRKVPGKPKPLSAKRKRALQLFKIPKEQQKYEMYLPMHELWCDYMRGILGLDSLDSQYGRFIDPRNAGPLLTSADYHGAKMDVVRSRCVSRVGIGGIVVRDTKATFELITTSNQLKSIPKEHTVFRFEIPVKARDDSNGSPHDADQVNRADAVAPTKPFVLELYGSNFQFRAPDRSTRKFVANMPPDL